MSDTPLLFPRKGMGMLHLAYAARTRQGIKYVRFSEQDVLGAKRETVGLYNPTAAQSR